VGVRTAGGVVIAYADPAQPPSSIGTVGSQASAGGVVEFDRDEFAALIRGKGYSVQWEKAAWCPDRRGASPQSHNIACKICDGTGFVYYAATSTLPDGTPLKMLVTSAKLSQQFYAYGRWDNGTVYVTAMPEYKLSYWDRLTLTETEVRFAELVTRTPGTKLDRLKYDAISIDFIAWLDRNGQKKVYNVATDVRITNGRLEWLVSGQPDDNTQYSVSYSYRPRYTVLDLLHQHRESPVGGTQYEFPVQVMAKLDFLVRDEGRDSAAAPDQNPIAG